MTNLFTEDDGPQPPRALRSALEVLAHLRPLLDNHIPLTIQFNERNQRFQSFLIELDRDRGHLLLDEMIPNDGERFLANGESFQVEGSHEGARIAWQTSTPVQITELDGARCYRTALPTEIVYHQRRNAYRAPLTGQSVSATLKGRRLPQALAGQLRDISATGCKLVLAGNRVEGLQPGQVYEQFSAHLPLGLVETPVELRYARYDEKTDTTQCGIRFHQMSGLLQRQIERLVYQLQREARRDNDERFR